MEDFLEALLFIVPITSVVGGTIYIIRSRIRKLQLELAEERGANQTAKIATEKSELEERVRVLERIVTDRGFDVATQIEALRDRSPVLGHVTHDPVAYDTGVPLKFESKEKA